MRAYNSFIDNGLCLAVAVIVVALSAFTVRADVPPDEPPAAATDHAQVETEGDQPVADAVQPAQPTAKEIHVRAARSAVRQRAWERAIEHLEEALALDPDDLALRSEYAGVLFQSGRAARALSEYERILDRDPERAAVRDAAVDAAFSIRSWDRALELLDTYPEAARGERFWQIRKARALAWTGRSGQALPLYEQLVNESPGERKLFKEYLTVLLAANAWQRLNDASRAYHEQWPDDVEVRLYRADLLLRQDMLGEALDLLESLAADPGTDTAEVQIRLADLRLATGAEVADVRADLARAAEERIAPKIHAELAILHAYEEQYHLAYDALDRAAEQGAPAQLLNAARAELLALAGLYRTALDRYDRITRLGRADARTLKGQARAAMPIHRYDAARTALRRALIRFPGDMDATYEYAHLLELRGETGEALDVVNAILDRFPDNLTARLLRGRLLRAAGESGEAAKAFRVVADAIARTGIERTIARGRITASHLDLVPPEVWRIVVEREPETARARAELARALQRTGELEAAADAWNEAVRLAPDNAAYRVGLIETLAALGIGRDSENADRVERMLPELVADESLSRSVGLQLAELLVKLERWEDVATVADRLLTRQPDAAHAAALLAGARYSLGRSHPSDPRLGNFTDNPGNLPAQFRFHSRLAAFGHASDHSAYLAGVRRLEALRETHPDNRDILHAVGRLAATHKDYARGRQALNALLDMNPTDPVALLWLARLESWDNRFRRAADLYRRYAEANPSDRRARLERARVLGWALEYDAALDEYTRAIAATGADDPPGPGASEWARQFHLEREAKRAKWNKRERHAAGKYDDLLTLEPRDPEILFDRGQIDTRLGYSRRAADAYRRTLLLAPGHTQARDALDYEEHRMNARVRMETSYRDEDGFGNLFDIREHLLTATAWSPELWEMFWIGAEVQRGWYRFDGFRDPAVWRGRVMLRKRFHNGLQLDGWYLRSRYSVTDHNTDNFGFSADYKAFDFLETRLSTTHEDILENFRTIAADLQRNVYRVDLAADITRRIRAEGWAGWVHVDDGNDGRRGRASLSYELLQYPTLLKLAYAVEYWDYDSQGRVYFAPDDFVQHGPSLHWRHYLNEEHYAGANELYYGIKLPLLLDDTGEVYAGIGLEFLWDITDQWQLGADATWTESDPYDATSGRVWLRYRF